jgi:hypothetical protein
MRFAGPKKWPMSFAPEKKRRSMACRESDIHTEDPCQLPQPRLNPFWFIRHLP